MKSVILFCALGVVALSGCASVSEGAAMMQPESASPALGAASSLRTGDARILDPRINPAAGVQVAAEGDALVVRFAHPHGAGTVERLDPASLETVSEAAAQVDSTSAHAGPQRVVIDGGRHFIVCWKSGDGENGYRAMAQAFNSSDGSPRGAPVAISPFDADVSGSLSAATTDGHRVVATFAASNGNSFAAYAVPLEAL